MSTVLVLGGSGYIGSAVVDELVGAGHAVLGLARSDSSAERLMSSGAEALRGDIRRPDEWVDSVRDVDAIVHAAATFTDDMAEVEQNLVTALLNRVENYRCRKRLIYTGGVWLYGSGGTAAITEETPFDPLASFAWMVEQRVRLIDSAYLQTTIIHPAMVYDRNGGALSSFINDAKAGGPMHVVGGLDVHWPLVHRDDLATLYRLALEAPNAGTDYNAAAEPGVAVGSLARAVAQRFGVADTIVVKSVDSVVAEMGDWARGLAYDQRMLGELARDELAWRPKYLDAVAEQRQATGDLR